jgi:kumamolisin
MNAAPTVGGLESLETAHQALGRILSALKPGVTQAGNGSTQTYQKAAKAASAARDGRCRNYLRFAAPQGSMPIVSSPPFRVADLCAAYNFPTELAGGGVIGILELGGGYKQSDLDHFSQVNGLPQIVPTNVSVSGGQNSPGSLADIEVLLDIQVAAAAYYYCTGQIPTIKVFFAPNSFSSFEDVINAASAAGCDILSISWGLDEVGWNPALANQLEAAAKAATDKGMVIFAAAGDNSSGDAGAGANVDMPSSCPHIVGCGGTRKFPFSEVVWGDGTPNGEGTGGGYSILFPLQDWQVGVPPTGGSRMVPDVAADAAPDTGYLIVANGQEFRVGGTSAVAPLYSGLFAALGQKLGFITPTLYQNPDAFVDITQGSNGSFQAAEGPDPCTGLGVPDGMALTALFAGAAPAKRKRAQVAGSV